MMKITMSQWPSFRRAFPVAAALTCLQTGAGLATAQASATNRQLSDSSSCLNFSWSLQRELLSAGGRFAFVDAPSIVSTRSGVTLIGSPTARWGTKTSFIDSSQTSTASAQMLGVRANADMRVQSFVTSPWRERRIYSPYAVSAGSGKLGVFWGEAPNASSSNPFPSIKELWFATLEGNTWGAPELVLRGNDIKWTREQSSVTHTSGSLSAVIPAIVGDGDSTKSGVVIVTRRATAWTSSWIDVRTIPPAYAKSVTSPGGVSVVAFIGSVNLSGNQHYGLHVALSVDSGRTWSEPTLLRKMNSSESGVAPNLVRIGNELLVVWGRRVGNEHSVRGIEMLSSKDEGKSWQQRPYFEFAQPGTGLVVQSMDSTAPIAVSRELATNRLIVAAFVSGKWQFARSPEAATSDGYVVLSDLQNDGMLVTWTSLRERGIHGAPMIAAPVLMYSRLQKPSSIGLLSSVRCEPTAASSGTNPRDKP